jgi:hypothetical protein
MISGCAGMRFSDSTADRRRAVSEPTAFCLEICTMEATVMTGKGYEGRDLLIDTNPEAKKSKLGQIS